MGNGLYLLVLLPYIIRNSQVHFDMKALRGMISYGAPLLWAALFTVILNVIDRYSLNFLSALESVAVYTLAFKIASTLKLVVADSIKLAVGPLIIKKMDLPGHERFYTKIWLYSSFVLMFSIVGLSLFSQEVVSLVSSSAFYDTAFFLIPVLTLSVFFVNLKDLNVYGLVISKKTGAMGLIVAIASAAGVGLNALLIPVLNTFGAALASFAAQLLFWLMVYKISQKHYPLKYETRKLLIIIIIGTAFAFSGFLLKDLDLLPRIGIKLLLLAAYPLAYLPLHFYEKSEIEAFKGFVKKWSRLRNLKNNIRSVSGDLDS
jgi:O-antigen/teichoic acid export membrane protein